MDIHAIKSSLLSDEYINNVANSGYWVGEHHKGSHILEYFLDNNLEIEYANSSSRKRIIKNYIEQKIDSILNELESFEGLTLFRSMYLRALPETTTGHFGIFWSTRNNTVPCVEKTNPSDIEVLLSTPFISEKVNWVETVKSRLDYLFGDKEEEIQIFEDEAVVVELNVID